MEPLPNVHIKLLLLCFIVNNIDLSLSTLTSQKTVTDIKIDDDNHHQESLEGCPHLKFPSGSVFPLPVCNGHGSKVSDIGDDDDDGIGKFL